MTDAPLRLDGWKAIAAHLRRSRNTTMRWAQDHDFPVRRMPSKRGGSVWAYAHELDAWLANEAPAKIVSAGEASETLDAGAQEAAGSATGVRGQKIGLAALVLAALVAIIAALIALRIAAPPVRRPRSAPGDAAVAELYLQARDDWAARTPGALRKAMSEFGKVISRDPGFGPAYTGLADVYIASGDYAGMPGEVSFAKAEAAARAGVAIDPENADAYRILGYAYWDIWSTSDTISAPPARTSTDRSVSSPTMPRRISGSEAACASLATSTNPCASCASPVVWSQGPRPHRCSTLGRCGFAAQAIRVWLNSRASPTRGLPT